VSRREFARYQTPPGRDVDRNAIRMAAWRECSQGRIPPAATRHAQCARRRPRSPPPDGVAKREALLLTSTARLRSERRSAWRRCARARCRPRATTQTDGCSAMARATVAEERPRRRVQAARQWTDPRGGQPSAKMRPLHPTRAGRSARLTDGWESGTRTPPHAVSKLRRRGIDDGRITTAIGGAGPQRKDVNGLTSQNVKELDSPRPMGRGKPPLVAAGTARPAPIERDLPADARGAPMVDKLKKLWLDDSSSMGRRERSTILTHTLNYGARGIDGMALTSVRNGAAISLRRREHGRPALRGVQMCLLREV